MHRELTAFALIVAFAGAALAHSGVQNPKVKAWMANMELIAEQTKLIGGMAKGATAFDADAAEAALALIAARAEEIPALFAEEADDPKSESLPLIWTQWDDFEREAASLVEIAAKSKVETLDDLRVALRDVGATCKSCHGTYRE